MEQKADVVQDAKGNAVSGADVTVLGRDKQPAVIFDANGVKIDNPIRTGLLGEFAFSAPNGVYYTRTALAGRVLDLRGPFSLFDPDERTDSQAFTILDFVPQSERAAIVAGTSTYDATAAAQAAIDAAGSKHRLHWLGTVNTRALSSADSVDWEFEAGAKIRQIPATYPPGSSHITLTGPGIRISGGEFDGNQDAMVAGQGSSGLMVSGASPTLLCVKAHDYNGNGYGCNSSNVGFRRGMHIGCNFDDNAGLGMQNYAASYLDFMGCTFDRNGYGFQKNRANYADTSHGFVAFGVAVRMRSHHINFTNCSARDNGRDGFNVNQGSYAIKYAQCLAHGNDDGGFTIASDQTNSGLPGEAEACYGIEYVDCEAYNNYGSGLVAYQTCHNVSVIGGRYYNNHRLAGNVAAASSLYNGIYFAAGSTGISVDAKVFDDRQVRTVTASAAGVLTAAGWVAGTMNYYPKVAIYNGSDWAFKGYGRITAESSGSVTITPTTVNGVSLAAIAVGDYVSQAVQHNGVFTDNGCTGYVAADGAGHRFGASTATTGKLIFSGGYSYSQNIQLPKERASSVELIVNPSFDASTANWSFNFPSGGSQAYHTGTFKRSAGSLQLVAGPANAEAVAALVPNAVDAVNGGFVELGIWAFAYGLGDAQLILLWQIGGSYFDTRAQHPGGGWRYLKIGAMVPAGSTDLIVRAVASANKTVYFDTASLRSVDIHSDPREFTFPTRSLPL